MINKRTKRSFLARNPFERGFTDGLFYREKMRAIHIIAPPHLPEGANILEIGGGRSQMALNLYLRGHVTTLDSDADLAKDLAPLPRSTIVHGDARSLPFNDSTFDLTTMFDVLEHIDDDRKAALEAIRVTKPGGWILISTPFQNWHYPAYGFMRRFCPSEQSLMKEWGHVRRGYTPAAIERLFGRPPELTANFINPVTAFYHDVAFSHLSRWKRKMLYIMAALPVMVSYMLHQPTTRGTEMACAWQM